MSLSLAELLLGNYGTNLPSVAIPFGTTRTGLDHWVSDYYSDCYRAQVSPKAEVIIFDPDFTESETEDYINQFFNKIYFYERNNQLSFQKGQDELVTQAKIFISTSGSWLLKQYDSLNESTLKEYEFAIFIERPDNDLFSESVLRIKLGQGLIPKMAQSGNGIEELDVEGPAKVLEVLKSRVFQKEAYPLSAEQIKTIIGKCYVPDDILKFIIKVLIGDTINKSQILTDALSTATEYLSDLCFKNLRIDESTWNLRYGDSLPQNLFQPIVSAIDRADKTLTLAKDNPLVKVAPYAEEVINYLLEALNTLREVIASILEVTADAFAIFCGIWNGFIDLIGGILQLLSWIASLSNQVLFALNDPVLSSQLLKEYYDEIIQAIRKIDWNAVKKSAENALKIFRFKMTYVYPYAIEQKLKSLNDTEIAYYCGYALFELAQWIIPPLKFAKLSKLKTLSITEDVVDRLQEGAQKHLGRKLPDGAEKTSEMAAASFSAYIDELLKILRGGTKGVSKAVEEIIKSVIKWIDELVATLKPPAKEELLASWDEISRVRGRGRKLGQKLVKKDLEKIELYLKWKKCDLQLFPERGTFVIEAYTSADGRAAMLNEGAAAMIITDGVKTKMCLREGATVYEFFHEYMHLKHSKVLGLKTYHKLGGKYTPGELVKEQFVFEKIMENKEYFTRAELSHALSYWNEEVRRFHGLYPEEVDLDLEKLPEIRKELDIEKILKK